MRAGNVWPDPFAGAYKESIVFETDAPYLAPTPYRGKMNEPKYIYETVKYAADMLNISFEEMQNISFKNSLEILNIKYED